MVVTLQLISTLRIFSQVYVMTNGGPACASSSVIHYIYNEAIQRQHFGYASAVAMLLFAADHRHHGHPAFRHPRALGDGGNRDAADQSAPPAVGPAARHAARLARSASSSPLLWAMPFVWMVSTSFKFPGDVMTVEVEWLPRRVTLDNYIKVFAVPGRPLGLQQRLRVRRQHGDSASLFGAMAGYALARLRFPGRDFLFFLFLASLMIPTEVTVVPLLLGIIKIGWANSYQALICLPLTNVYSIYIFRQFFLGFPRDLEDAAKMDGAGHFLIFCRIAFPLARAPLIAATVIVFTLNWNNFLWPLLVVFDESMKTLPVGIAAFAPVVGTRTQLEGLLPWRMAGSHHPQRAQPAALLLPAALFHPGSIERRGTGMRLGHGATAPTILNCHPGESRVHIPEGRVYGPRLSPG